MRESIEKKSVMFDSAVLTFVIKKRHPDAYHHKNISASAIVLL